MKKFVLILLILAVVTGAAYSIDLRIFPSPISKGNILISPIFNFGFFGWGYYSGLDVALGGSVAVDYALPVPVMVGLEVGVAGVTEEYTPIAIPILARASWHPNWGVPKLDTYVRLKLGGNIGLGKLPLDGGRWGGGFAYGFQAGVRYFFTDIIGVFGELGYDRYGISLHWDNDYWGGRSWGHGYIYTFLHAGVTFKLGKSSGSSTSARSSSSSSKSTQTVSVNADALNMRSEPSSSGAIVKTLKRGDVLTVTGSARNGWLPVQFEGANGWVSESYVN